MDFQERIYDFLFKQTDVQKQMDELCNSPYPVLYIKSKNLYLHLIYIDERLDNIKDEKVNHKKLSDLHKLVLGEKLENAHSSIADVNGLIKIMKALNITL